ncbi:MAG: hypothetical protein ACD_19C00187G0003 [uncultured bacterium]|nr:MAG: hypothetical protein ACD_19C00187G0003 [uncultured bacterium]
MTQMTKSNRRGWSGFSAEELSARLEEALMTKSVADELKEKYQPTYRPVEMPLASETPIARRVMTAIDNDPRTTATVEQKWDIMKSEHEAKIKEDKKARVQASEIIEGKIQSQLKSMNISPDSYIYSREFAREENEE